MHSRIFWQLLADTLPITVRQYANANNDPDELAASSIQTHAPEAIASASVKRAYRQVSQ